MAVVVMGATTVGPTLALNKGKYYLYDQNSIWFYDPDARIECEQGTTIPGDSPNGTFVGGESWDGSCSAMTASRIAWVEKYLSAMQKAASKNGIPWELIPAQTFQESGGGKQEACDNNPLGLKAKSGHAACSNGFAKFSSHEEAFEYYMNSITPIRELKNKYPNDPYSAVSFIEYGASHAYASCDSESYSQCVGHMGEPTPGYVNSVSSLICGIQKWAKEVGVAISSVMSDNYSTSGDTVTAEEGEEVELVDGTPASYCDEDGQRTGEDEDYVEPEAGNLASYVKSWAWPTYEKGKTEQMPAYREYMSTRATYKGDCSGNDCGAFVANIIKASGWDTGYPQCSTDCQRPWLAANWTKIDDISSLRLGDVGIKTSPGHVILYVGNISGFNSNTASASQCDRAPMAGRDSNLNVYTWYRRR